MKTNMSTEKAKLYKTAKAKIGCTLFKAGQYVSVKFSSQQGEHGTLWFEITKSDTGELAHPIMYPEHHLESFCL